MSLVNRPVRVCDKCNKDIVGRLTVHVCPCCGKDICVKCQETEDRSRKTESIEQVSTSTGGPATKRGRKPKETPQPTLTAAIANSENIEIHTPPGQSDNEITQVRILNSTGHAQSQTGAILAALAPWDGAIPETLLKPEEVKYLKELLGEAYKVAKL